MFERISPALMQRAMHPPVSYGRGILAQTLRRVLEAHDAVTYTILTQPEPWEIARAQFADMAGGQVLSIGSLEQDGLTALEQTMPPTDVIMGIGGGQALDTAKFVAWRRKIPLILAPTIVSVDAAVTNTIAIRERQRVRYVGFVVADAIPVDFSVIAQAPLSLNRAGIGDLLSIHTALWDWQHADATYDETIAAQLTPILDELEARGGDIADGHDAALRFIMESYVRENTLCLRVGSSRPEEGSEHYLGYNLEYITGRSFVHGQLICLCTYAMARLQQNRAERVRSILRRTQCPWRLRELAISHEEFVSALLTLQSYAASEAFPASVITQRPITPAFAAQLAQECDGPDERG
jgi:glycerol-1-phosphate dehydrogenase [NAD(P)+]